MDYRLGARAEKMARGAELTMPTQPARPCAVPGCPGLTQQQAGRYCELHRDRERQAQRNWSSMHDKTRKSSHARGYDRRWRRLRSAVLAAEPLCRHCLSVGRSRRADDVDHIIPISRGGLRLDRDNLQSLCRECHARKTATEDGGFGRGRGV